jgi:hypothetical protein
MRKENLIMSKYSSPTYALKKAIIIWKVIAAGKAREKAEAYTALGITFIDRSYCPCCQFAADARDAIIGKAEEAMCDFCPVEDWGDGSQQCLDLYPKISFYREYREAVCAEDKDAIAEAAAKVVATLEAALATYRQADKEKLK